MLIEKRMNSDLGVLPDAYGFLSSAPGIHAGGKEGHRPPLGIYNISIRRLVEALARTSRELNELHSRAAGPEEGDGLRWLEPVMESQGEVLSAAQAHIDDCAEIAAAALGGGALRKTDVGRRYLRFVGDYADRVSRIANHIKHYHGRLRPFSFYTPDECFPGYIVEGVDRAGIVGPEPTVHRHGHGAFSFARDLRLHFVWIYGVSSALAEVLASAVDHPAASVSALADSDEYFELAESIVGLPARFYPDEVSLPVPSTRLSGQGKDRELRLSYTQEQLGTAIPRDRRMRIATVWQGDGVSKSFRLPYRFVEDPGNVGVLQRIKP